MKWNHDLKWTLMLLPVGALAGVITAIYQLSAMDPTLTAQLPSRSLILLTSAIQVMIYLGISSFFGFKLARRTGLDKPFDFSPRTLALSLFVGLICALVISGSDKWIFMPLIAPLQSTAGAYTISPVYLSVGILYGGIVEEFLMRLLLMSLIVWLLSKIKGATPLPHWIYWLANGIVALLFAAGHLPATAAMIGLTPVIVIRCFVLNGIAGFLFGLLYWKKGIGAAVVAHASTHIINQLLIMPLLF